MNTKDKNPACGIEETPALRKLVTQADRFFCDFNCGFFAGKIIIEESARERWRRAFQFDQQSDLENQIEQGKLSRSVLAKAKATVARLNCERMKQFGPVAESLLRAVAIRAAAFEADIGKMNAMRAFALRLGKMSNQVKELSAFEMDVVLSLRGQGVKHTRKKVAVEKIRLDRGGKQASRKSKDFELTPHEVRLVAGLRYFGLKHTQDFILRRNLKLTDEINGVLWSRPKPPLSAQGLEESPPQISETAKSRDDLLHDFIIDHWFSSSTVSLSCCSWPALLTILQGLNLRDISHCKPKEGSAQKKRQIDFLRERDSQEVPLDSLRKLIKRLSLEKLNCAVQLQHISIRNIHGAKVVVVA